MRIDEIIPTQNLTEGEIKFLYEFHREQLSRIIDANIKQPLAATVASVVSSVAPKLKQWALVTYHDLNKGVDTDITADLLRRIINNPEEITKQLIEKASTQLCANVPKMQGLL